MATPDEIVWQSPSGTDVPMLLTEHPRAGFPVFTLYIPDAPGRQACATMDAADAESMARAILDVCAKARTIRAEAELAAMRARGYSGDD